MGQDKREEAGKPAEVVNESVKVWRTSYLWFMLTSIYVGVTIFSTTDMQLLLESTISLPILNIGLPVVDVYYVTPPIYVAVHFYILLQLSLIAPRVRRCSSQEQKKLISFIVIEKLLHKKTLVNLQAILSLVWIPMVLLLGIQYRFLPYHDFSAANWHRLWILIDAGVIVCFWYAIFHKPVAPEQQSSPQWKRLLQWLKSPLWRRLRHLFSRLSRLKRLLWVCAFSLMSFLISLFILAVPAEEEDQELSLNRLEKRVHQLVYWQPFTKWRHWLFADNQYRDAFPKRNLVIRQENLTRISDPQQLAETLNEYTEDFSDLSTLAPEQIAKKRNRLRFYGIHLKGRDLRHADLSESVLINANIEDTRWDHARLNFVTMDYLLGGNAIFNRTELLGAQLYGADLRGIQFNGTDAVAPEKFQFNGADLRGAQFNGADLRGAQFNSADLSKAQLNGADLVEAQFNDADLVDAYLNGADLSRAQLNSTDLNRAQLNGVLLRSSELNGADLRGAQLNGADLSPSTPNGLSFSYGKDNSMIVYPNTSTMNIVVYKDTELNGANLYGTKLKSATLGYITWYGSQWGNNEFSGSYWTPGIISTEDTQRITEILNQLNRNQLAEIIRSATQKPLNLPFESEYSSGLYVDGELIQGFTAYQLQEFHFDFLMEYACSSSASSCYIIQGIYRNFPAFYFMEKWTSKLDDPQCTGFYNLPEAFKKALRKGTDLSKLSCESPTGYPR